ncbi:unnamed protein product, partial [Amoebophrya sp. A120]
GPSFSIFRPRTGKRRALRFCCPPCATWPAAPSPRTPCQNRGPAQAQARTGRGRFDLA